MPFGLKTAPSIFQRAMSKIFSSILDSTLVYMDDILLFSSDYYSHLELLKKFADLVRKNGTMLSQKKMQLASTKIEFLGMHLKDGQYKLHEHLAEPLLLFPDKNFSKLQMQ